MKIRIKGDSLRLRVTQGEVARLAAGETVREVCRFGPAQQLSYQLSAGSTQTLQARYGEEGIYIEVPAEALQRWALSESQVSLQHEQNLESGGPLQLLVEKDFACLAPRAGEDDSDAFPHPRADSEHC